MATAVIGRATTDAEIEACYKVLSRLRPHLSRADLLPAVRRMEKEGFRLAYLSVAGKIRAVMGYRIIEMLRTGKIVEIDDLVTAEGFRSQGHGKMMLDWIRTEAQRNNCRYIELDSAVERKQAHRFYFREHMHVLAFHFSLALHGTDP